MPRARSLLSLLNLSSRQDFCPAVTTPVEETDCSVFFLHFSLMISERLPGHFHANQKIASHFLGGLLLSARTAFHRKMDPSAWSLELAATFPRFLPAASRLSAIIGFALVLLFWTPFGMGRQAFTDWTLCLPLQSGETFSPSCDGLGEGDIVWPSSLVRKDPSTLPILLFFL